MKRFADGVMEIAAPVLFPIGSTRLAPLAPEALPFLVGVGLEEVPIPSELVDTVIERTQQ